MSVHFDTVRTYSYIKGMAMGCGWTNTVEALAYAREKHRDQYRKSGEPYFIHPLTIAGHAVALGIHDDATIAAALLHDVVEDCNVQVSDLPVSQEVQEIVKALTFSYEHDDKNVGLKYYYANILENRKACIIKLLDRCNNVSTMAGVFTEKKLVEYIKETEEYVLPLIRAVKDKWPTDSNLLFVLKYHIQAVTDGLKACMEMKNPNE